MKLTYTGKTKDVYMLDNGHALLQFKDDVTGENGVFDPGANTVGLSIDGMGKLNLAMSKYYFELLGEKSVKTHYVSCDADKGTMEVLSASPFGKGLEVICRLRAVGSFIRRYGAYVEAGTPLPAYVEMTLKDDERGDPLITQEGLQVLGVMTRQQYEDAADMTRRITRIIAEDLASRGLELYDIKLEFGFAGGQVILMDEIASGNMRVYENGQVLDPIALTRRVLG